MIRVFEANPVVYLDLPFNHREFHFAKVGEEGHPLGGFASLKFTGILGKVIATEDEILGWSGDGFAARWREEVVRCEHQQPGFHLCLYG